MKIMKNTNECFTPISMYMHAKGVLINLSKNACRLASYNNPKVLPYCGLKN
jgi:hypothetical protein